MSKLREVVRWGNSLGVRIPFRLFSLTNFKEGDCVRFEVVDSDTLQIVREEYGGDGGG